MQTFLVLLVILGDDGGFYFTDPGGSREKPIGTVHYVDAAGRTHLAAGGMSVPNGLVLSPDCRRLYVAETVPNRVVWFEVTRPGELGPLNVLSNFPHKEGVDGPDGLAADIRGNIYVTGSIGRRFQSPGREFRLELSDVQGVSSLLTRR
jgi:gluconolactonase